MDFRGECGCGGIPSIMFTQAGGISDRDGRNSTPGSNLPQVDPVTGRDGNLYSHTWWFLCHHYGHFADQCLDKQPKEINLEIVVVMLI